MAAHTVPRPSSSSPSGGRLFRSISTSGLSRSPRIDSILEQGRARKVAMNDTEGDGPRDAQEGHERESSADEETYVLRREANGGGMAYQGTQVSGRAKTSDAGSVRRRRAQSREEEEGAAPATEDGSWWKRVSSGYGSIELENKGSVARDHLALERTFLAWLRTSLAFASIGIAITQLFRLNTTTAAADVDGDQFQRLRQMGKPLGATFVGISILMLGVGFHRYFESQHWIIRGKFPASRGSIALVALITFALMVTSLVVVCVVEPGKYEK